MGNHMTVFVKREHLGVPHHLWVSEAEHRKKNLSGSPSDDWVQHRTDGNKLLASAFKVNMFFDEDYAGLFYSYIHLGYDGIDFPNKIDDKMVTEMRVSYYFALPPQGPTRELGYYEVVEDSVTSYAYLHWDGKESGRYRMEIWSKTLRSANMLFNGIREGTMKPERSWSNEQK